MITKALTAAAASLLAIGLAGLPANAQDQKAAEPKGIKVKPLVASVGFPPFKATVNTPIAISGATVEMERGGQTGRHMAQPQERQPAAGQVLDRAYWLSRRSHGPDARRLGSEFVDRRAGGGTSPARRRFTSRSRR